MKVSYECASCMLRQSREAIEQAVNDEKHRMDITLDVLDFMHDNFKKNKQSNKLGTDLHHYIMDKTGNYDPYKKLRLKGNLVATNLLSTVEKYLDDNPSFENYVRVAVAGNVIDFGALEESTDIESFLLRQINVDPVINDTDLLEKSLKKVRTVLYLADNGGEIVFDKLLIQKIKEEYDVEITLALKESPILNDALVSDAKNLNLDKYANLISTGASSVGVVEEYVSNELKNLLNNVDLVISKGMGNFEGLTEMKIDSPVFFLLTTKCNVISREIGVGINSPIIVKKNLS